MGGTNFTTGVPEPSTEPEPTMSEEEIVKIQFYKTYDVMTGVRIAATLGGFFSLMVLLVIYKSKCKSRSLSDENLEAAVAAAVVEEEKMELAFGLRLTLYDGGGRRSLGNMSAPVYQTRFSSVGGASSLFTPPLRIGFSPRARVSLPTSSPFVYPSPFLPRALLLDNPSPKPYREVRDAELRDRRLSVIQPTPEISPCESQTSLYNCPSSNDGLHVPRVAPLASISSCGLPSIEHDNHSVGSDSVFLDEELVDTEDEVEEFSTDSDAENIDCNIPSIESKLSKRGSKKEKEHLKENRVPIRRFSTPTPSINRSDNQLKHLESLEDSTSPSTSKMVTEIKPSRLTLLKTSSDSDTIHVSSGGEEQTSGKNNKSISVPRAYMSVSCDQLVKILQEHSSENEGNKTIVEHCTWSQETLF